MTMTTEVRGLKELAATLRAMPQGVHDKVLRGAVSSAAAVMRKEAIQRAPVYTGSVAKGHPPPGTLKRAIYQVRLTEQCTPILEVWAVTIARGKGARNDAFYASMVEYGTVKMTARPFFRPAFEATKEGAAEAMRAYMDAHLPEAIRQAA